VSSRVCGLLTLTLARSHSHAPSHSLLSSLLSFSLAIATAAAPLLFSCRARNTYRATFRAHDHLSNLAILRHSACVTLAKRIFYTASGARQPRYTLKTGREQAEDQLLLFVRKLFTRASSFAALTRVSVIRAPTTRTSTVDTVNAPVLRLGRGPRLLTCTTRRPDPEH
jgi:hypothetical protein